MSISSFRAGDVSELIAVWNAAAGGAFPLSARLFRQNTLGDPHFDPAGCFIARAVGVGGPVLGFCLAKVTREPLAADGLLPDRGWIGMIAVHPSVQRRGTGTLLLRAAEAFLRERGRSRVVLGGDPAHFFPGVPAGSHDLVAGLPAGGAPAGGRAPVVRSGAPGGPAAPLPEPSGPACSDVSVDPAAPPGRGSPAHSKAAPAVRFFAARGYAFRGEAYDLRRPVHGYRTPPAVKAALAAHPDLVIRAVEPGEEGALLRFLDAAFPGRWRYTMGRFLEGGGAVTDVMGVMRGDTVLGFAHLFHPGSAWIGPSIAWARGPEPRLDPAASRPPAAGGLGPIGLAPELRGRGLGLALLDRAIRRLARLGAVEIVVDWTALLAFYGKLGFEPWRRYRHGERRLDNRSRPPEARRRSSASERRRAIRS